MRRLTLVMWFVGLLFAVACSAIEPAYVGPLGKQKSQHCGPINGFGEG